MSDLNGNHVAHVLDPQEVLEAAEESMFGMENLGFCIDCGAEHYECEECGEHKVYGAPELVLMGFAG